MGCWNFTCGLSGLPIRNGDPVIAMMIKDNRYRCGSSLTPSHPWQMFSPASFIERGHYNDDHAWFDPDPDALDRFMRTEEYCRTIMVDTDVVPNGKTSGGVQIVTLEEAFRPGFHQPRNSPYALWMAHAPIYDRLLDIPVSVSETAWQEMSVRDAVKKILNSVMKDSLDPNIPIFRDGWSPSSSTFSGPAISYIGNLMLTHRYIVREVGCRNAKLSESEYTMLVSAWADLRALYLMMEALRVSMTVCGACGSQNQDYDAHAMFSETILDFIVARKTQDKNDYDYDYDD